MLRCPRRRHPGLPRRAGPRPASTARDRRDRVRSKRPRASPTRRLRFGARSKLSDSRVQNAEIERRRFSRRVRIVTIRPSSFFSPDGSPLADARPRRRAACSPRSGGERRQRKRSPISRRSIRVQASPRPGRWSSEGLAHRRRSSRSRRAWRPSAIRRLRSTRTRRRCVPASTAAPGHPNSPASTPSGRSLSSWN